MPTRSDESRWPSITTELRGSCCSRSAISSRHALCSLLILAELNGKKIGPHGTFTLTFTGGGGGPSTTVIDVEQLPPGHGWSQRLLSVATLTVTVIVPGRAPDVSRVTSEPVVDESCP